MAKLALISITICLLVIICVMCTSDLRLKWKQQIKAGLQEGKNTAKYFTDQKDARVLNRINLMSNYLGVVNSFAALLQEFDPKTENNDVKEMKKLFLDINSKLNQASAKRFGRKFRSIFYDLMDIEFSYKLLSKFLEKMEELKCDSKTKCKEQIKWTIGIFKNDFNVKAHYKRILKSVLHKTEDSEKSVIEQLKDNSGCDLSTIIAFGKNIILKLFQAEQIIVIYEKLATTDSKPLSEVSAWAKDMYEVRDRLVKIMLECRPEPTCTINCRTTKCFNTSNGHQMCRCNSHYDGDNCRIRNPLSLLRYSLSLMTTINKRPKMGELIDVKYITNYLFCSMNCLSVGLDTVREYNYRAVNKKFFTSQDFGAFYNVYLDIRYYMVMKKQAIKCNAKEINETNPVLHRTAIQLPRILFKGHHYICNKENDNNISLDPVLNSYIHFHKEEICSGNFHKNVDNLWRFLHLYQMDGFLLWLEFNNALNRPLSNIITLYEEQTEIQANCGKDITCKLKLNNAVPVDVSCLNWFDLRSQNIQIKCQDRFKRLGSIYLTCKEPAPICVPCDCWTEGSRSFVCNQNTGQCPCKSYYYGQKCTDRDCKWGSWSSWKAFGWLQRTRSRTKLFEELGNGKNCTGSHAQTIGKE